MSSSFDSEFLVQANRAQIGSEADPFTVKRYRQFAKHFPSGTQRVLDVGGGTGRGGREMKRIFPQLSLTGLDCVPERAESMDETVYQERICAFADSLPFVDESFDVIVAGEFIEHVPGPKVEPTLHEFFRVLRLRGRLLLTTPNPNYIRNKIQGLSVISDSSHVSQHYPKVLKFRLRMAGFSRVRVVGSGKVSRFLGSRFPLPLYGSYLCTASKW
jgi:ubiquinone/menaquinone biosynthesis C-methylase UbiE